MPLDPSDLYRLEPELPNAPGMVLVIALDGFIDAGWARRLARTHLLATLEPTLVATFDVDQLYDYRARRPAMVFVEDHWESYEDPELVLHCLTDSAGTPFLLLSGAEPDVQWERFVTAVHELVVRLGVRLTVGLNAIPMGVPHTRAVGVLLHGSRKELLGDQLPWIDTVQVPASAAHLIEYRLGKLGVDTLGLAVQVPHYVANVDYPAAALALVQEVARVGDLSLPVDELVTAATEARAAIDAQVEDSPELGQLVSAVEQSYDEFLAGRAQARIDGMSLPTGDELGAQFEAFLAERTDKDDKA
ncbi:MAG: hypothetical protein QOJ92_1023 [Frankiales bacterium]|nr:hypothetical protein [Frankiales bacterium]